MSTLHRKTCHLEGFYITCAFLRSRGYSSWFVHLFFKNEKQQYAHIAFTRGRIIITCWVRRLITNFGERPPHTKPRFVIRGRRSAFQAHEQSVQLSCKKDPDEMNADLSRRRLPFLKQTDPEKVRN